MRVLGIDPGSVKSGYALVEFIDKDPPKLIDGAKVENGILLEICRDHARPPAWSGLTFMVIELTRPRGGKPFPVKSADTLVWTGRFQEAVSRDWPYTHRPVRLYTRMAIAGHLLQERNPKGTDSRIKRVIARIFAGTDDIFVAKGTTARPGPLFDVADDVWQAIAAAVCGFDRRREVELADV